MNEEIIELANSLFKVLSQLKGISFQTENYLKSHSKKIERSFGEMPVSHFTSSYILSDLKAKSPKDSRQIYLGSYGVDNKNVSSQIETNINFYFSLSLSHSYEIFEIYIKRLLRIVEKHDPQTIALHIDKRDMRDSSASKSIDNLNSSNNKSYFKLIRKILPGVGRVEQSNSRNVHLTDWYQAFSNFRHSITHRNMICSDVQYRKYKKLTDQYFPVKKHCNSPNCEKWRFLIDYDTLTENLILTGEYGYLIAEEFGHRYGFEMK